MLATKMENPILKMMDEKDFQLGYKNAQNITDY